MAKTKIIKLENLLVNTENFRFETIASQKEAIDTMIDDQKVKLYNLAADIVKDGLNPNDKIQVIRSNQNQRKFIVLEGNRRTIALKLLDNPDLIDDPRYLSLKKRFNKLHAENENNLVEEIECILYDDPTEANKWIKLKHAGQNEGIGTVDWNAQQIQRFEEKVEGKSSIALQAINILKDSSETPNDIKENLGDLKITNLDRLLSDPDVRKFLGVTVKSGMLESEVDQKEVTKGLIQVATDIMRPNFKVKEIYTKENRLNYLKKFPKESTPDTNKKSAERWNFTNGSSKSKPKTTRKKKPLSTERKNLIPKKCSLKIENPKVNAIYHELQKLDVTKFTNAAAVSFRVFVELSVDCYIEKHKLTQNPSATRSGMNFQQKVSQVANHLQSLKLVDSAISKGIKVSIKNKNDLLGLDTWHAYVHNNRFSPKVKDLLTIWDGMQDFITILWDNVD